jgi:ubiquinone/menaquinone biosynthesis C-methylase UbiE
LKLRARRRGMTLAAADAVRQGERTMTGWARPRRRDAVELLDSASLDARALAGNLRDLRRANRWLGGLAVVRRHLWRAIATCPLDEPGRVLDVGTGAADLPLALATWARRQGRPIRVVGLDHHAQVIAYAARQTRAHPAIRLVRADACALPFPGGAFDYAVCALTLHHLPPHDAVALLAALARVARRGVVVSDLERSWPAYAATWLWSRVCTANPLTRHDGPLSVLRAYSPAELRALAAAAGLPAARVYREPFFRLALVVWRGAQQ